jgi:hypothetical protein
VGPPCRDRQGPPRGLRDLESPTRSVGAPELFRRARWRYQACGRGALEVHHLVKRAQGGSDFELDRLVALCPPCHVRTDASDARGRLIIRRHDAVPIRAPPDQARRPDGTAVVASTMGPPARSSEKRTALRHAREHRTARATGTRPARRRSQSDARSAALRGKDKDSRPPDSEAIILGQIGPCDDQPGPVARRHKH